MSSVSRFLRVGAIMFGLLMVLCAVLTLLGPIAIPLFSYFPTILSYTAVPILLAIFGPRLLLLSRQFQELQHNRELMVSQALLWGLICFLLMNFFVARMQAVAVYDFATGDDPSGRTATSLSSEVKNSMVQSRTAVINEVWLSLSLIPELRRHCFSDDAQLCMLADEALTSYDAGGFSGYSPTKASLWVFILSAVVGVTGAGLVIYPEIDNILRQGGKDGLLEG